MAKMTRDMDALQAEIKSVNTKLRDAQVESNHWHRELADLQGKTKDYRRFAKSFPSQVKEVFENLTREEKAQEQEREAERQAQQAQQQQHKKSHDIGGR
jgi:predicted  nucleic acid-binding Zn-ribbon protein